VESYDHALSLDSGYAEAWLYRGLALAGMGRVHEALRDLGAETIEIPTIEIRDPASWEPLDQAIRRLEEFRYLLVTSASGVRNFLKRLHACGRDVRDLKGLEIGAVGPATAAEFAKTGVRVDFVPREYRAEGLLEAHLFPWATHPRLPFFFFFPAGHGLPSLI
jgi:hypothetical protein